MDLQATAQILGNFGEFVGAIAVVGTLVYLAIQVRHSRASLDANTRSLDENRALAKAEAVRQVTQRYDEIARHASKSLEFASIFVQGSKDLSELNDVEQFIFYNQLAPFFNHHVTSLQLSQAGILDPEMADLVDKFIADMLIANTGTRTYWDAIQGSFPQEHTARVNEMVSQGYASGRPAYGRPIVPGSSD
jgi:hypothetical protein